MKARGVNPLIATVLLLLVSLSIAGLLYSWLSNYAVSQTAKATQLSEKTLISCSEAGFKINACTYDLNYNSSNKDRVTLKLESTGDVDLNEFVISVLHKDGNVSRMTSDQNLLARSFLTIVTTTTHSYNPSSVKVIPQNCPSYSQTTTTCS